ncbi:DUF461 domain-containing protein [Streptomyces violaceusniger]|uniref:DUF461 domain-containing protein n=1 Tax=Streptomyces violaceusniger TaxID=68280 RepID=UPI0009989BFE|nr:DUF461 domain-containing protein [Streptomyces hygroscopicus]AQW51635.1 hypothetical protein SHXM_05098 [Streptomyces hygroscopicus]
MSSSLRRGALAAAAIVVSVAPLSACGAGNDAQTLEVKPDNAATAVGDIKIQNATLVTQPDRKAKGPAVVTGRLFNNGKGDQTVKAITLPGTAARVKLSPAKGKTGPVVVPAGGSVAFGGEGNASAVISDGREAAQDGNAERVVFDLSSTGNIPVTAFVVPATSYFKGWGPSELPTAKPSGSATPSGTPSGKPSGTPSGKPSGTPSGSASGQPGSDQSSGAPNGIATGEPNPNGGGH